MRALAMRGLPAAVILIAALIAWGLALGRPAAETASQASPPPRVEVLKLAPGGQRVTVRTHGSVAPRTESMKLTRVSKRRSSPRRR